MSGRNARAARRPPPTPAPPVAPVSGAADAGAAEAAAGSLEDTVCRLAARGLDEDEIRARLGLPARPAEPDDSDEAAEAAEPDAAAEAQRAREQVLAGAFARGRLLGRAQIKEAQFDSALAGRVTAQAQVLARLGEPEGGGEADGDGQEPEPAGGKNGRGMGGRRGKARQVAVARRVREA